MVCTLDFLKKKQKAVICDFDLNVDQEHLNRIFELGLHKGMVVSVEEKIPGSCYIINNEEGEKFAIRGIEVKCIKVQTLS